MNDTTYQGNGKITYVPVVVNAKPPKQTNADRIRSMTDDELATFLFQSRIDKLSEREWHDWLKQEASE